MRIPQKPSLIRNDQGCLGRQAPILRLRIELLLIEPLIWRRLQLPGDYTFWDLHVAIQSAFGWSDTHLHEFRPWSHRDGGSRFGHPMDEFDEVAPSLPG